MIITTIYRQFYSFQESLFPKIKQNYLFTEEPVMTKEMDVQDKSSYIWCTSTDKKYYRNLPIFKLFLGLTMKLIIVIQKH